jgi:hypothetical protein
MPTERCRVENPKTANPRNTREARRRFIKQALAAASVPLAAGSEAAAQAAGTIREFDHVALPMLNTDAMLAFYRGLGLQVSENAQACSVYIGTQMINFHRPATWQRETFTLRAPAAKPPCGDLCFVWEGTPESLKAMLDRANARAVGERPGPASTCGIPMGIFSSSSATRDT